MNWIIYSIIGAILTSIWSILLELSNNFISKGITSKFIYILLIFVISGIISFIILLYYYYIGYDKLLLKNLKKNKYLIFISSIILILSLYFVQLGLSGGGIALSIINFNMLIVLIISSILFNDKINLKIVLSIILSLIITSYAVILSNKINKS